MTPGVSNSYWTGVDMCVCGLVPSVGMVGVKDVAGCMLTRDHHGPHEFQTQSGSTWQWEPNRECGCIECSIGERSCVMYREKKLQESGAETTDTSSIAECSEDTPKPRLVDPRQMNLF